MAKFVKETIDNVRGDKQGGEKSPPDIKKPEEVKKIKKAKLEPENRKTFDKMQKKIKKPKCFGKYGSVDDRCWQCWYHPDCKVNTK